MKKLSLITTFLMLTGVALVSCNKSTTESLETEVAQAQKKADENLNQPSKGANGISSTTEQDVINTLINKLNFKDITLHNDYTGHSQLTDIINNHGYTLSNANLADVTYIEVSNGNFILNVPYSNQSFIQAFIFGTVENPNGWQLDFVLNNALPVNPEVGITKISSYNVNRELLLTNSVDLNNNEGIYIREVSAFDNVLVAPAYLGKAMAPDHPDGQSINDCIVADFQDFTSDAAGMLAATFMGPIVGGAIIAHCAWHSWL